jgi:threonine/homoserine/homoserine lactone efflux protein
MMMAVTYSPVSWAPSATLWPYIQFFVGYIFILITPGPNMMVVGTIAACRGLRGVLLLVVAIGLGAAILSLFMLLAVQFAAPTSELRVVITVANVVLLAFIAWRILRIRDITSTAKIGFSKGPRHDFVVGFLCGLLNPMTAAYFLSQYLNHSQVLALNGESTLLVLGVMGLAIINLTLVALLLSQPMAQIWVRQHLRKVTRFSGFAIALMALQAAKPLLPFVPI